MKKMMDALRSALRSKMVVPALLLAAVGSVRAEGFTPDTAVTSAITSLEAAATGYAGVILPYIVAVGLAFIGISVVYLLFKVFRRFVGGK